MTHTTYHIRKLTDYQIEQLTYMFKHHIVEHLSIAFETGTLFVQYRGGIDYYAISKAKNITPQPNTGDTQQPIELWSKQAEE